MSFLNKIKKLFQEEEKPKEKDAEAISQNELAQRVESLVKTSEAGSNKLKKGIKDRISRFNRELTASIEILNKNDLSKRKDYAKVKTIVLQNRDTYVSCLSNLLKNAQKIEEAGVVIYINKILLAINDFRKASAMPYEKATYLIGKEMAATMEIVRQFAKDISDIGEQNKPLFEETAAIERVSSLSNELKREESLEEETNREILRLNLRIKGLDDEGELTQNEISAIKAGEAHKRDLQAKENHKKEQEKIKKELEKLKQKIDFKALSKVFHHDKKKAALIKEYSSRFIDALRNDENLSIIPLVHESQSADIFELKGLKEQLIESEFPLNLETEAKLSNLDERIRAIAAEKAKLSENMHEENKKLEKQKGKKHKTLSDLKDLLGKLNIAIKD
jgi:hypothetical protein